MYSAYQTRKYTAVTHTNTTCMPLTRFSVWTNHLTDRGFNKRANSPSLLGRFCPLERLTNAYSAMPGCTLGSRRIFGCSIITYAYQLPVVRCGQLIFMVFSFMFRQFAAVDNSLNDFVVVSSDMNRDGNMTSNCSTKGVPKTAGCNAIDEQQPSSIDDVRRAQRSNFTLATRADRFKALLSLPGNQDCHFTQQNIVIYQRAFLF